MEKKHEIFKKHLNKWFVETGTYGGDGVQAALDAGFENIISMDISQDNIDRCKERFKDKPNVNLICADSAIALYDAIKDIDDTITFWLDAHWSGEGSPTGQVKIPLLYELNQIADMRNAHKYTILIDDIRCWRGFSPIRDFDLFNVWATLKAINNDWIFSHEDGTEPADVLVVEP